MNDVDTKNLTRDEFWKAHILSARAAGLSDINYCKKNLLSVWKFATFKKKLGFTKVKGATSTPKVSSFVRALPEMTEQVSKTVKADPVLKPHPPLNYLPDPKWLAEYTCALLESKKST
jgi:hypothetical protein